MTYETEMLEMQKLDEKLMAMSETEVDEYMSGLSRRVIASEIEEIRLENVTGIDKNLKSFDFMKEIIEL
jgi:hypothetical protein